MFLPGDIYTSSGSLKLYHCWTDKVTKFDSSAFYNWEQDNMPLYDLEERTFYLWEQLGYPTSSIPGVALVVSADATDQDVTCNKNIFRTVSAAIEALPQTINYPIIIEVANFGELGELKLNNYKFGPRGSLEIINRNFALQELGVSNALAPGLLLGAMSATINGGSNLFKHVSSVNENYYVGLSIPGYLALAAKTTPLQGFLDSSCLSISCAVFSSTYDSRLSGVGSLSPKLNGYVSYDKIQSTFNKSTLIVDSKNNYNPYKSNIYDLAFQPYYLNPDASDDITSKDASCFDWFDNAITYGTENLTSKLVNGLFFGNKLSKVVINNCDGPIFIRNFFLDGKGNSETGNKYGVEVNNSPNIYLENMVSCRYRKAGYYFNNSNVNLLRSCVANRIYDYDSDGNRITGDFSARRLAITYNDSSGFFRQDESAGLIANNSTVNLSSTIAWELARYEEDPAYTTTYKMLPAAYHVLEFNENSNGIILNNSNLVGGYSTDPNYPIRSWTQSILDCNNNTNCGLISNNSMVSLNGRIRLIENLYGAKVESSKFDFEEIEVQRNQLIGLVLNNSKSIYNKNLLKLHSAGTLYPNDSSPPFYFYKNGIHLDLDSSDLTPAITSSMELRYHKSTFQSPIGFRGAESISESIRVSNNSNATLMSPEIIRSVTYAVTNLGKKGSEINCRSNSKVTLRGTKYFPSKIIGPPDYTYNKKLASLAATNNSIINVQGPTKIAQFGINLLADKNSTINIAPPKNDMDGTLDISSISLIDPANHTMVELHSSRACIVVDNNSVLDMKDLGSYTTRWDLTDISSSGVDYEDQATYVSGGSLQFYPNPNSDGAGSEDISSYINSNFINYSQGYGSFRPLTTNTLDFSAVTLGGMCVRALNNSVVNVHNVNFPCGWWNPSAPYYNSEITFDEGGACYRLFIWNIADSSQLKASYLMVSGLHPSVAGYKGPYGYWKNAAGQAASGLPAGTPDTSSLSILDIYGENPSGTAFTNLTAQNNGPFRLYFGTNPFVNTLTYTDSGDGYGIIPQIYSQGYQPSTTLICSGDASGLYRMSLLRNSAGNIAPSGFYYGSGVMDTAGFSRIILDESAANTFANAKHCAAGKSGNARLVSIYYPYIAVDQGDSNPNYGIASVNMFDIEREN